MTTRKNRNADRHSLGGGYGRPGQPIPSHGAGAPPLTVPQTLLSTPKPATHEPSNHPDPRVTPALGQRRRSGCSHRQLSPTSIPMFENTFLNSATTQRGGRLPIKQPEHIDLPSLREPLPFVFDMLHMRTPDQGQLGAAGHVGLDEQDCQKIINALRKGGELSPFQVSVNLPIGATAKTGLMMDYRVSIEAGGRPDATKNFATFNLHIELLGVPEAKTRIVVGFSRDDSVEKPTGFGMSIQGNPTTLMTGQNTRPPRPYCRHVVLNWLTCSTCRSLS